MRDFVPHDHGHFVIGHLERVENAGIERDLAAWHAKGVDLLAADQVDLPFPLFGARIPLGSEGQDLLRDGAQASHLGIVVRCQRLLLCGLAQHLLVLLGGSGFHLFSRHQLGKRGSLADIDPLLGRLFTRGCRQRQKGCPHENGNGGELGHG